MRFLPSEWFIVSVIVSIVLLDVTLIASKGISVDIAGYASLIAVGLGLMALAQYYRVVRREERLALALNAGGMFTLFSLAGSVLNYMFLPIDFTPIDETLLRIDAALGYNWPTLMAWVALHPWLGKLLYCVYFTALPQLLIIILVLSFAGDARQLHHFLLTGIIGALLAIGIWILFPNFGAKSYNALPREVLDAFPIAVTPAYGEALLALARNGVDHLSSKHVLGLIGFPSFHTVMACMSVIFVPRKRFLRPVFLLLNALMLLAIPVQGGHHLIDVFGGIAVFCVAFLLSAQILMLIADRRATLA